MLDDVFIGFWQSTRSVFVRYNIVSERDIAEAATKPEAFYATCSQNVHNDAESGKVEEHAEAAKMLMLQ